MKDPSVGPIVRLRILLIWGPVQKVGYEAVAAYLSEYTRKEMLVLAVLPET